MNLICCPFDQRSTIFNNTIPVEEFFLHVHDKVFLSFTISVPDADIDPKLFISFSEIFKFTCDDAAADVGDNQIVRNIELYTFRSFNSFFYN